MMSFVQGEKELKSLALHEKLKIDEDVFVFRVFGGLIYEFVVESSKNHVFVPFKDKNL